MADTHNELWTHIQKDSENRLKYLQIIYGAQKSTKMENTSMKRQPHLQ